VGRKPASYNFDWSKGLTALQQVLLISYNPLSYIVRTSGIMKRLCRARPNFRIEGYNSGSPPLEFKGSDSGPSDRERTSKVNLASFLKNLTISFVVSLLFRSLKML
jgi:hypothetical protein